MIVPEMIGSIVGVYNGKTFSQVEIKVSSIAVCKLEDTSVENLIDETHFVKKKH